MARPKSTSPTRDKPIPIRYLPIEKRFVEAARDKELNETLRPMGISQYGLSEFVRAAAFERSQRVLGMTLEEFQATERRRTSEK